MNGSSGDAASGLNRGSRSPELIHECRRAVLTPENAPGALDTARNWLFELQDTCPWDCEAVSDRDVGIDDFLQLLAQWIMMGTSCDFNGGGVGIDDFLALLANWGPCPVD